MRDSVDLADTYCRLRGVPVENMVLLSLGSKPYDTIERSRYDRLIANPIRNNIQFRKRKGQIRCLLTTYGVPFRVGRRGVLPGMQAQLETLQQMADKERTLCEEKGIKTSPKLEELTIAMDRISGKETDAALDSELSMVLFDTYELYRWQPNLLKDTSLEFDSRTLMVCSLDGPGAAIARGLIDKSLAAEKTGLKGRVYVDSRARFDRDAFGDYDQSLRDLALLVQAKTSLRVKHENTPELFAVACSEAALYCGWYRLGKYTDIFDFVNGAVGFHIASSEAVNLRDPESSQWCPAMLVHGITATLGPVAEPYLHAFPKPRAFFNELIEGRCLVEAFYRTKPFNSWMMVLIGDPLYCPFAFGRKGLDDPLSMGRFLK
jgi:uncharacterized protein (TIGR03790 family)